MASLKAATTAAKNVQFKYNGAFCQYARYFCWNYLWSGRQLGLQFHDTYFEPAPEVTEALRRLNLKEPWVADERKKRLTIAQTLKLHHERLPREQWTRWEEETWYLKSYLDEIEAEKKARESSSGLLPSFSLRQSIKKMFVH